MVLRRTVTSKEAMESRRAAFLAAYDRTHGKEAMESCRTKFLAVGGDTVTWADFEAAMAEWVVDLEAAKAAQKERKRQKVVKKRECRHCKKKEATRRGEESLAEIEAQWATAYKAEKEDAGVWPACPDGSM